MMIRRGVWRAAWASVILPVMLLSSTCLAAANGATTAPAGEAAKPAETPGSVGKPSTEPHDWFKPLKDIPAGPGLLSVDMNVRTRYEWQDNFNIKGYGTDTRDDLLMMRTQLGLDYRLVCPSGATAPHFYVQAQDSRYWLSELARDGFPTNCPHFDQFDLRQAYAEWRRIAGSPVGFKVGRQSIFYRDKRVFGPGDWGNVGGYWWDAAKLYIETEAVDVDLIYGKRIISEQTRFNDEWYDFDMAAAYVQIKNIPFILDLFYLLKYDDEGKVSGETGTGDEKRHTFGLHAEGKVERWDYATTLAWQTGEIGPDEICAFGGNAGAGYTFDAPWKPRVGAAFAYASGDRKPHDGRSNTFDGMFAGVGGVYGWMNLVSLKNIEDYEIKFSVQPCKNLTLAMEYHIFHLASDTDGWYWCNGKSIRRDSGGDSGNNIGNEIDIYAKWKICANLELQAGYSHFCAGSFVSGTSPNKMGGNDNADWVYTQLTFKF